MERGGRVGALHRRAVRLVCAKAQAGAFARVEPMLTEAELAAARRARNTKLSPPRHADPADYQKATALEALLGYLYVTGQSERLHALLEAALPPEEIGQAGER